MKKIFIIHSNMEIGGAETSLLGLLKSIDYSQYSIDLLLLNKVGELLEMIPKEVNLLNQYNEYSNLLNPIRDTIKNRELGIAISRVRGKLRAKKENKRMNNSGDLCYLTKEYSHKYCLNNLPKIKGEYDLGISFIDPHYILKERVNAKVKLGWLHTDFSRIKVNKDEDFKMWNGCDYIVSVSDACKNAFDKVYPSLSSKSIVIENILPEDFVKNQANLINVDNEILKHNGEGVINICSIGRFSEQKNFDNVPNIAKMIISSGYKIRWYLIGYGVDEEIIRSKIKQEGLESEVIILGKKINPYPYIKQCDIYVQPSRYEGKAVTVREAQILNKPVVITDFVTAKSQLEDKVDGIIVPMDNLGCSQGIISLIKNKELQKTLIKNTKIRDYSNKSEINKIYKLIESVEEIRVDKGNCYNTCL